MDQTDYKRLKLLLEPCQTAEDLDNFLRGYLNIALPWDVVDEDSTSSSLSFLWRAYSFLLTGKGESKHVVAAARNTAKTLTASLFQFLSMLHFRRDGVHLAALLSQSGAMIDYIDNYLRIPELGPYKNIDNYRKKMLAGLPPNDICSRSEAVLRVLTASKKGTNAPRASTLSFDEVELIDPAILSEAAYIADPARDGICRDPIFLYLSSRKIAQGPMQALMDTASSPQAKDRRICLHKWSTVDWQERCPPEISLAPQGGEKAFINTEDLGVIWGQEMFDFSVSEGIKTLYREVNAFQGCMTCPAFLACQGRAVRQRGDSKMLRNRFFVGDVLENVREPSAIIAQTLNWKPESTALVFKSFAWYKHVGDARKFYEFVSGGEAYNPVNFTEEELEEKLENGTKQEIMALSPTKADIFLAMRKAGWRINYGVDWGFRPAPSVVVVSGYHMRWKKACVLHVDYANDYANGDWAAYIAQKVWSLYPGDVVCPDMADKSSPVHFKKVGLACIDTKPSRIQTGVSQLRGFLWNPMTQQASFMIFDDGIEKGGNRKLIEAFQNWTHKKIPMGYDFEDFQDDGFCDFLDPTRYAFDMFIEKREGRMSTSHSPTPREAMIKEMEDKVLQSRLEQEKTVKQVFQDTVLREMGISISLGDPTPPKPADPSKKKLKFSF